MIVTNNFVYIHTSRHGGTFINKFLFNFFPDAFQVGYHYQREKLPEKYTHLPVIGFVRNPFDWYVSMFNDYRRKRQIVYKVASRNHPHDFKKTVSNMLNFGSSSELAKTQLNMLINVLPDKISNPHLKIHALTKSDFVNFEDIGYYSWLWRRMHIKNNRFNDVLYGRFENFRDELVRLLHETNVDITEEMKSFIYNHPKINTSTRYEYKRYYDNKLIELLYQKDKLIFEIFDYRF